MARTVLALDIGGTKIAAGLVDADGQLLHSNRQPTPRSGDPDEVWAAAERTIADALAAAGGRGRRRGHLLGRAHRPPDGTISPVNIAAWRGFPFASASPQAVPGVPVRLAGDGLCMALGEHWRGAGQGAAFMLGMVVSTGIGGGLVLDGAPYDGRTGNAGHVGHVVVDPDGPPCTCGGARLRGDDRQRTAPGGLGPRAGLGRRRRQGTGRRRCRAETRSRCGPSSGARRAVAAMIASVAAVCDLDLVVIGGGVAKAGPVLFDPLREALRDYAGAGLHQRSAGAARRARWRGGSGGCGCVAARNG